MGSALTSFSQHPPGFSEDPQHPRAEHGRSSQSTLLFLGEAVPNTFLLLLKEELISPSVDGEKNPSPGI